MELRHLRYFVAVAEELNFRKASERLRVAQPALSSQIQDLEAELGVRLLDRNTGGVHLTSAGAAFLAETRLTLAQAEKAANVAKEAAKGNRGRLLVAHIGSLNMTFMPPTMKAFRGRFPDVEVVMVDMPAFSDQIKALDAGELHLAFAARFKEEIPAHFKEMLVLQSQARVAVSRDHRLAKMSKVPLEELSKETFVCLGSKVGEGAHAVIIRRIFASVGLKPGPLKPLDGPEAMHAMLASGLAASILAESVNLAQRRDIVLKPIKNPGANIKFELRVFWRNDPGALLANNFAEMLRANRKVKE